MFSHFAYKMAIIQIVIDWIDLKRAGSTQWMRGVGAVSPPKLGVDSVRRQLPGNLEPSARLTCTATL